MCLISLVYYWVLAFVVWIEFVGLGQSYIRFHLPAADLGFEELGVGRAGASQLRSDLLGLVGGVQMPLDGGGGSA